MSDQDWDPAAEHEAPADSVGPGIEPADAKPQYPTLEAWMDGWFVRTVRRRTGRAGVVWCAQWWEHAEARSRLSALWGAWEQAQIDLGSAPSGWWIWHFDAHWGQLTSPAGPFTACGADRHEPDPDPLPSAPRLVEVAGTDAG